MTDVVAALGARLGWTPGQAWTVLPGLAVTVPVLAATVLGVLGQPASSAPSATALPPAAVVPAPAGPALDPPPAAAPEPPPALPALIGPPAVVGPGLPPGLLPPRAAAPGGERATPAPAPSGARPTPPPGAPLTVAESGWSSRLGPDPTVPAGSLPVQAGPSGELARSFLRLSRPVPTLRLRLVDEPGASYGEQVAGVVACQNVSADWTGGGGQPPAAAPQTDAERCVAGTRQDDSVTFDLRRLPSSAGAGLTLLPAPPGPAPFRLVLSTVLEDR